MFATLGGYLVQEVINDILTHANEQKPLESCGFVVSVGDKKQYIACANMASDPVNFFEIHPDDWLNARLIGDIIAIVHSHPNGYPVLSEMDRQMQVNSGVDWWLVVGDEVKIFKCVPHLLYRDFEHIKSDCYTLIKDAYMLSGVELPEFEYDENWYEKGLNLYEDNLIKFSFEQVNEPQLGDILLFKNGSSVGNHAGIYLGDGYFLHHSPKRKSRREPLGGYWYERLCGIWRSKQCTQLDFTGLLNDLAASSI